MSITLDGQPAMVIMPTGESIRMRSWLASSEYVQQVMQAIAGNAQLAVETGINQMLVGQITDAVKNKLNLPTAIQRMSIIPRLLGQADRICVFMDVAPPATPATREMRMTWSCSDYVKHEHKYRLTAWLCGMAQRIGFECWEFCK